VITEENSSDGKAVATQGKVPLERLTTFYTRHDNYFGLLIIISTVGFILIILIKKKKLRSNKD